MTILVSIVSMLASAIAIYVGLYVKSHVGPILAKLESHNEWIDEHRGAIKEARNRETELWEKLHGVSERVAQLEGGRGGRGEQGRWPVST